MRRLIEIRDLLVHPVDRERVLDEIVGADAQEVDFACDEIDDGRGQLIPADEALALARQRLPEGRIRRAS